MSMERVISALTSFGLSRSEAEVYIYTANRGPQKAEDLAESLNFCKSTVYSCLKNLKKKQLVSKDHATYSALPFEEALDLLIAREKKQANHLQERKKRLLERWNKE